MNRNIYHVNKNAKLMVQNVIQIKSGNIQYPKSVIIYDKIIEVTKIMKLFQKKLFSGKTILYFSQFFINNHITTIDNP